MVRTFGEWDISHEANKIFHGLGLGIQSLEDAELANAVQHAHEERRSVHDDQEPDLGPHQALLSFVPPCHQDAILTWGAKLPGTKHKQGIVNARGKDDPPSCHPAGPNHQNHLEVEMQKHTRACDLLGAEVCLEWVQRPLASVIFGCVQLLTGSELLSLVKFMWVADWSHGQIDHPNESEEATRHAEADQCDQLKPHLVVAESVRINCVECLAFCASVGAIVIELRAMLNHGASARVLAFDDIRDWSSGIEFCAH
jgi:hypothetical protein